MWSTDVSGSLCKAFDNAIFDPRMVKFKYWLVCIGLRYTDVSKVLLALVTRISRKAILLS